MHHRGGRDRGDEPPSVALGSDPGIEDSEDSPVLPVTDQTAQLERTPELAGFSREELRKWYGVMHLARVLDDKAPNYLKQGLGWSYHATQGFGWIALAIVIFGGWHPVRGAFGAYLFGALQTLGGQLQATFTGVPIQVFQVAPFALMIVVLLVTNNEGLDRLLAYLPRDSARLISRVIRGRAPAALGSNFQQE